MIEHSDIKEHPVPLFVWPKHDELFSSWIYRLAHSNYCTPKEFYRIYLNLVFHPKRDYDQMVSEEIIHALKQLVFIEEKMIQDCTMRYFENKLFSIQQSYKPNKWVLRPGYESKRMLKPHLQYCPRCRKLHFETWYKLILFTICFDCGSELKTNCDHCNQPINFSRLDTGKKFHSFDIEINTCHNCFKSVCNGNYKFSTECTLKLEIAWKNALLENDLEANETYFEILYRIAFGLQFIPFQFIQCLANFIGIYVFENEKPDELCKLSIEGRRGLFTLAGSIFPPDSYFK